MKKIGRQGNPSLNSAGTRDICKDIKELDISEKISKGPRKNEPNLAKG